MKNFAKLILCVTLAGCNPNNNYDFEYDIIITNSAVNISDLNTSYDDYNSDLPYDYAVKEIYFSTNRNSYGNDFDIIGKRLEINYHSKDDVLNMHIAGEPFDQEFTNTLFGKVNSDKDEFGPYSHYDDNNLLFMFATNVTDTFKINMVEYTNWNISKTSEVFDPIELSGINHVGNNLYPTLGVTDTDLYFCSDRNDSVYNIYEAVYSDVLTKQTLVEGAVSLLEKNTVLSSNFNDKCPYIFNDVMVFASDRENGLGGFDLYYSKYVEGKWSIPKMFGSNINSAYDEYRPIIFHTLGFDIMIFSSNRPGGKGGFDLYVVNVKEIFN